MATVTLIKVGNRAKVESVRERGQTDLKSLQGSEGTVLARRIVDGSGVGYILEFDDKSTQWFFDDEVQPI